MKDVSIRSLISQLSILVVGCLLLATPAVSQTASITGRVTNDDGTVPIANVDVWVCTGQCEVKADWKGHDLTDVEGDYTITGLIDSQAYKVKFYTTYAPSYVSEWYKDQYSFAIANPVMATDAGATADANLEAGSYLTGKVVDINRNPIAGATVYAREGDEWIASTVTTAVDGNDNNYTLPGLSASRTYDIFFYADNIGYPNEWYNDQEAIDGSITVPAGATTVQGGATRVDAILGVFETSSNFNWLLFLPTIIINTTKL